MGMEAQMRIPVRVRMGRLEVLLCIWVWFGLAWACVSSIEHRDGDLYMSLMFLFSFSSESAIGVFSLSGRKEQSLIISIARSSWRHRGIFMGGQVFFALE